MSSSSSLLSDINLCCKTDFGPTIGRRIGVFLQNVPSVDVPTVHCLRSLPLRWITQNMRLQEPFVHHATPGDLWWALSKTVPYVHQVCLLPENPHPSKFFAIEILRPLPSNRPKTGRPIEHPCYRLRRDDSRAGIARVYDFQLRAGESTGLHSWSMCGVILCLAIGTGGRVESNAAAEPAGGLREEAGGNPFEDGVLSHVGGWKWVDEPVSFDVRNNSDKTYEAIVVEWLGEEEPVDGNARL